MVKRVNPTNSVGDECSPKRWTRQRFTRLQKGGMDCSSDVRNFSERKLFGRKFRRPDRVMKFLS
jgi:hypothetical protein